MRVRDYFSVVADPPIDSVIHVKTNSTMRLFSPAKVNLLLAVTGKREDGFHNLVSLVTPITYGDYVTVTLTDRENEIVFECPDPNVPSGDSNLVVQAARAYLEAQKSKQGMKILLEKHIPLEAGMGGGSSNTTTTLIILNQLFEKSLGIHELTGLASGLGSDCPLFLYKTPVLLHGRGEVIEQLPPTVIDNLEGKLIAVFKPGMGISTAWAYERLASGANFYADQDQIEAKIDSWRQGELSLEEILFNSFEGPVFEKFVAFPALFEQIQTELGLTCLMSGSGSACFTLLSGTSQIVVLQKLVEDAFGVDVFYKICRIGLETD